MHHTSFERRSTHTTAHLTIHPVGSKDTIFIHRWDAGTLRNPATYAESHKPAAELHSEPQKGTHKTRELLKKPLLLELSLRACTLEAALVKMRQTLVEAWGGRGDAYLHACRCALQTRMVLDSSTGKRPINGRKPHRPAKHPSRIYVASFC